MTSGRFTVFGALGAVHALQHLQPVGFGEPDVLAQALEVLDRERALLGQRTAAPSMMSTPTPIQDAAMVPKTPSDDADLALGSDAAEQQQQEPRDDEQRDDHDREARRLAAQLAADRLGRDRLRDRHDLLAEDLVLLGEPAHLASAVRWRSRPALTGWPIVMMPGVDGGAAPKRRRSIPMPTVANRASMTAAGRRRRCRSRRALHAERGARWRRSPRPGSRRCGSCDAPRGRRSTPPCPSWSS